MHKILAVAGLLQFVAVNLVTAIPLSRPCLGCLPDATIKERASTNSTVHLPLSFTSLKAAVPSNPGYSQYDIPRSPLSLELQVRNSLHREPISYCLTSAAAWVAAAVKTAQVPSAGFPWKDNAGAKLFIKPFKDALTWQDVADVIRGLKVWELGDAERPPVMMEASFAIKETATGERVGSGFLVKYQAPPLPPSVATVS